MSSEPVIEEVVSPSLKSELEEDRERRMKEASDFKERGNELFREKNYEDAAQMYSRCLLRLA